MIYIHNGVHLHVGMYMHVRACMHIVVYMHAVVYMHVVIFMHIWCLHAHCYLYTCYALQFITDVTNVRRRLLSSRHYEVSSYGACSTSQQEMKLQFVNTMTKENIAICPANPEEVGQIVLPPGLYHLEAYGHEWKVYVPGEVLCYNVSVCT